LNDYSQWADVYPVRDCGQLAEVLCWLSWHTAR
jgi:hypothetical protein